MSKIRPIQWGVLLSVIAIFLCVLTGMYMGLNEEGIREGWKASGMAVLDSMYKGDQNALTGMLDKAWTCFMRAHIHWAGLGAATLGMSFILLLVSVPNWYKQAASILMGLGSIIYPIAWLSIANNITVVGGAAKENASWIATIGIVCIVIGIAAIILGFVITMIKDGKSVKSEKLAA